MAFIINEENNLSKTSLSLTKKEIEFLLILIKDSIFKGENIELLYNLIVKLQTIYINEKN